MSHVGYGNPAGPLWFLGMEERLTGPRNVNLRWRLDHFRHPVDTVTNHNKAIWRRGKPPTTPTWRTMAKLARLLIEGAEDWDERRKALAYVLSDLGTAGGPTFLLELLPLPATGVSYDLRRWEYRDLFPAGRREYMDRVLQERIDLIRSWVKEHRPRVIICYGSAFWPYHQELFQASYIRHSFEDLGSRVILQTADWNSSRIVLTPFFAPYAFPARVMARLPELLGDRLDLLLPYEY